MCDSAIQSTTGIVIKADTILSIITLYFSDIFSNIMILEILYKIDTYLLVGTPVLAIRVLNTTIWFLIYVSTRCKRAPIGDSLNKIEYILDSA
jgi:hypothetical protein